MYNILAVNGDIWQLCSRHDRLTYCYTAIGQPVAAIAASFAAIDPHGHLHLILSLEDKRLLYACWQGSHWLVDTVRQDGIVLAFSLDTNGLPHVLLQDPAQMQIIHMHWNGSRWQQLRLPCKIAANPILLQPLTNGRLFLSGHNLSENEQQLIWLLYTPGGNWCDPQLIEGEYPAQGLYIYWYLEHLYLLCWYKQKYNYKLVLKTINSHGAVCQVVTPGTTAGLPDERPCLLGKEKVILFIWTSSNRLSFCLSPDGGQSWSRPHDSYFFFPTKVKALTGPLGAPSDQAAFIKVCGLEPEWPLLVNLEPLVALCKALLL